MSTPKELNIHAGDTVRFIASDPDPDISMLAAIVGGEFNQNAQEFAWDADFIQNGLIGRCTHVLPSPGGDVYKFVRIRKDGSLGAMSIPVKENEDCIETIVFGPYTV